MIKTHQKKRMIKPDPAYSSAILLLAGQRSASGAIIKIIDDDTSYAITVKHFCHGIKEEIKAMAAPHGVPDILNFDGKIERVHKSLDMCIIRLSGNTSKVSSMKIRKAPPHTGMRIYTIGAPAGSWPSKNLGYLTGLARSTVAPKDFKGYDLIVISVPSYYGSSGSPIYDGQNRLVGIIVAVNLKFHHNSIGIPAPIIYDFVSYLL